MAHSSSGTASARSSVLIASVLVIAALYFGRQIFIPLASAFVLSFLLTPAVAFLERIRFRRVPAVVTVMTLAMVLGGTLSWTVAKQLVEIMDSLPSYKANLDDKIKALHSPGSGELSRATATVQELNRELASVPAEIAGKAQEKDSRAARLAKPIPVQVAAPPSNFVQDLRELLGPLAEPLETAAIVIIFTLFIMMKREDLRNRVIRLAGRGKIRLMTKALDDASSRLGRYLFMQCLVNAGYGLLFGTALYVIGIPHAVLWGVFACVFRFVPYVGTFIAAALPIAMALAVFPGWHQAGQAFGIFLIIELTLSNILEPLLYGAHTGISALAILVAAIFWATLWGPVGLILSTPLTVCLIVLGRHVPQLKFLEVLLGDEPVLLPQQCFYQRLLATDVDEARGIAEQHLKERSLEDLYDNVFLPALKLAEQDRRANGLDDGTYEFVTQTVAELIEDFADHEAPDRAIANHETADQGLDAQGMEGNHLAQGLEKKGLDDGFAAHSAHAIACIPASAGSDELVVAMLGQLLRRAGYRTLELSSGTLDPSVPMLRRECEVLCVSSISAFGVAQARSLCKRLVSVLPAKPIFIGLWSFESASAQQRLGPGCSATVLTTLQDMVHQVCERDHRALPENAVEQSEKSQQVSV